MRALLALVLALTLWPAPAQARDVPAGTILFRDDFNGPGLSDRWEIPGEQTVVWVTDTGWLALGLDRQPDGTVKQARVETEQALDFTYGTFRARVRFVGDLGGHSAFWAQSRTVGGTAYCNDGCTEIDVAEHLGRQRVWHNLYWCPCSGGVYQQQRDSTDLDPSVAHIYRVDWTPTGYTFLVDGVVQAAFTTGLSDKPHFLTFTYLVSAWEMDDVPERTGGQRTYVDWVEVKANAWTEVAP